MLLSAIAAVLQPHGVGFHEVYLVGGLVPFGRGFAVLHLEKYHQCLEQQQVGGRSAYWLVLVANVSAGS